VSKPVLVVVRHAVAVSKRNWVEPDDARPLTRGGRAQAQRLVELLDEVLPDPITTILSSPTVRCLATMVALARHRNVGLSTTEALSVGQPAAALALARSLLHPTSGARGHKTPGAAVLCTHGEVLPGMLRGLEVLGDAPLDHCAKGSAWVLRLRRGEVVGRYLPVVGAPLGSNVPA
jgi:8-oxo-(d)GTP phosphatase